MTTTRIGIPALPCGNFMSVRKIIEKAGGTADIVETPEALAGYPKVILAGVGAFDHGMRSIRDAGWQAVLDRLALERRVPILGICLGMQMMCEASEEGSLPGLGWIRGQVRRFRLPETSDLKIPHMGWNAVRVCKSNPLIPADEGEQRFYFVHSYHALCEDASDCLATAHHGYDFTAAFSRSNIFGAQFHPEKSHRFGLALMRRFVELPC